jgi:hypothetical protein
VSESHARELLKAMLVSDCTLLVSLPEDGTEGQSAGLCALEALTALEELEAAGWRFLPPSPAAVDVHPGASS